MRSVVVRTSVLNLSDQPLPFSYQWNDGQPDCDHSSVLALFLSMRHLFNILIFSLFFIISQMYTMKYNHIHTLLPPNALPYLTNSHPSQLHFTFLFDSVWFLITLEVQFRSLIHAWPCGNPLEHGKPTRVHTFQKDWVHLTGQWSLPVVPYLEVRPGKPLPHLRWTFAWLELCPSRIGSHGCCENVVFLQTNSQTHPKHQEWTKSHGRGGRWYCPGAFWGWRFTWWNVAHHQHS